MLAWCITDCSGDVYLGQETKADPFGLLFAGHLNLEAVITDLQVTHGLGDGTGHSLLLAGSSAGGLGTFNNADFVTDMLPSVSVKANPQGFVAAAAALPYVRPLIVVACVVQWLLLPQHHSVPVLGCWRV